MGGDQGGRPAGRARLVRRSFAGVMGGAAAAWLMVALTAGADGQEPAGGETGPFPLDGALVIVGGGELPDEVRAEFVRLAGGWSARILVIPTASAHAEDADAEQYYLEDWRPLEPADLRLHHARSREEAASDGYLKPLAEATAVWFSGGDQSRLAERFLDTPVERELRRLLERGGVIGGTSAGAAIQTAVMIAGGREEPEIARGFDLLPMGIADQHFLARNRIGRLRKAVARHPDHAGWGIDESTALIVTREGVRVLGASTVTVIRATGEEGVFAERQLRSGDRAAWGELARE